MSCASRTSMLAVVSQALGLFMLFSTGALVHAQTAPAQATPPAAATAVPAVAGTAVPGAIPLAAPPSPLDLQVQRVSAELRCMVCQNQTIADSNADLAIDLRRQVRSMLQQGKSEADVLRYMTDRYGDFVLYRPPVKASTWLLWFGPALLLVGGLATLVLVLRRRARLAPDQFEPDEVEEPDAPEPQRGRG
jgi:cytochrome c-type biogenesis protein CcmH